MKSELTSENKSYKDKLSKANLTEEKLKKANKENDDEEIVLDLPPSINEDEN